MFPLMCAIFHYTLDQNMLALFIFYLYFVSYQQLITDNLFG